LVLAAILLNPVLYRLSYDGRVYPGVRVGAVEVGGLTRAEAASKLEAAGLVAKAPVVLVAGERRWPVAASASGLTYDGPATVAAAFAVGRSGAQPGAALEMLGARFAGKTVRPVVHADDAALRSAIAGLAAAYDQPAQDVGVRFEGGQVLAIPPEDGRELDQPGALDTLREAARSGLWPVKQLDLPHRTTRPALTDASAVVEAAKELLARPVTVASGDRTWTLAPEALAPMLRTAKEDGTSLTLALDPGAFAAWLAPVTQAVSTTAVSPRFHFDEAAGALTLQQPGRAGARVDAAKTAAAVLAAATADHRAEVAVQTVPPLVSDTIDAAELGIRELVHSETSRYAGSPSERVHNIGVAARKFDGLLIPPEAVFSFNEHLGDVSLAEGYVKGKIIMDGATADGVGGGVCQVSTTLFRAAFWTGLPIVERHAHGYRVAYYEQGNGPGLDATIYSPYVDLRFKNDTGNWLLIETGANPRQATVTFRLYGTRPTDRTVALEGPFQGARVPAPPARVQVDPSLAPGTRQVVENSRAGGHVRVVRVLTRNGEESRETFASSYRPTGALTLVGPEVAVAAAPADGGPPPPP
jgi:vancomycin resistance protein YoaR